MRMGIGQGGWVGRAQHVYHTPQRNMQGETQNDVPGNSVNLWYLAWFEDGVGDLRMAIHSAIDSIQGGAT